MRILVNLGNFGQGLEFFWAKLGKVYDIFGLCIGFFGQLFHLFGARKVSQACKWPGTPMVLHVATVEEEV